MEGSLRKRLCPLCSGAGSVGLYTVFFWPAPILPPYGVIYFFIVLSVFSLASLWSAIFVRFNVIKITLQSINPAKKIGYNRVSRLILCEFFTIFSMFRQSINPAKVTTVYLVSYCVIFFLLYFLYFACQFITCNLCHAKR